MIKIMKNKEYGSGVYAIRDIEENTVIYKEKISFMSNKEDKYWYDDIIFYELSNNYEKFMTLVPLTLDKQCFRDVSFRNNYNFLNISKSKINDFLILCYNKVIRNAFNVYYNNSNFATILYNGRKFNHSCSPNISFKLLIQNNILYMLFYTNSKITKNSQLFDNYFNINLSTNHRQLIAKTFYGFTCSCHKCLTL